MHSDPPTHSSLSKPRRKIASLHTAAPLAATTEEPYLAIFRFGVGAPPKLSSTMRASAESTETLEWYQGSTSLLSDCLLNPTPHSVSCGPQATCGFHHLAQRSPFPWLSQFLSCLNFYVSLSSRPWSHEIFLLSTYGKRNKQKHSATPSMKKTGDLIHSRYILHFIKPKSHGHCYHCAEKQEESECLWYKDWQVPRSMRKGGRNRLLCFNSLKEARKGSPEVWYSMVCIILPLLNTDAQGSYVWERACVQFHHMPV